MRKTYRVRISYSHPPSPRSEPRWDIITKCVQSVFINYQSSAKYHGYFYRASYQPLCWFVGRSTTGLIWLATGALNLWDILYIKVEKSSVRSVLFLPIWKKKFKTSHLLIYNIWNICLWLFHFFFVKSSQNNWRLLKKTSICSKSTIFRNRNKMFLDKRFFYGTTKIFSQKEDSVSLFIC